MAQNEYIVKTSIVMAVIESSLSKVLHDFAYGFYLPVGAEVSNLEPKVAFQFAYTALVGDFKKACAKEIYKSGEYIEIYNAVDVVNSAIYNTLSQALSDSSLPTVKIKDLLALQPETSASISLDYLKIVAYCDVECKHVILDLADSTWSSFVIAGASALVGAFVMGVATGFFEENSEDAFALL